MERGSQLADAALRGEVREKQQRRQRCDLADHPQGGVPPVRIPAYHAYVRALLGQTERCREPYPGVRSSDDHYFSPCLHFVVPGRVAATSSTGLNQTRARGDLLIG